jgi:hypothetical protein
MLMAEPALAAPTLARARPRPLLPAAAALPALLILVLLATVASYNAALTIRLAPTSEVRQVFYGFHGVERAADGYFRWTDGAAQICFEQLGRVANVVASVRILGAGAHALGRSEVGFFVNGQPIVTAPIQGATRVYHVHLGRAALASDDSCLGIVSEAAPIPSDVRTLGVPFAGVALAPLATADVTWPALAQLALNLTVATLVFWLLRQAGVGPWAALAGVAGVAALLAAAIVGRLTAPGLGMARNMLPLAAGLALVAGYIVAVRRAAGWRGRTSLLARDLVSMLFWSAALVGLTDLFQILLGFGGVWPLKAGFFPSPTPLLTLLPAALFVGWAWLVLRRLAVAERAALPITVALVLLGALLLPPAVKAATRGVEGLYLIFTNNPYEYIADVPRVGDDPLGFLRSFVAIKDQLALHSSTHPPGSILLLWAVERGLGPGPFWASWTTIALSALAPLAGLWLGLRLGGPRLGLLAGALAAVMPGQLVFAATSMDGVFNTLLALGAAAFLLALERPMRPASAALAGLLIALGLFFTYAATQLFFFGAAVAVVALARELAAAGPTAGERLRAAAPVLRQGLVAAAVIVLIYLGVFLASGYNVAEGALRATAINVEVMRSVTDRPFLPPSLAYYTLYLAANLLAFGWYLGPWGLAATVGAGATALGRRPLDGLAALAAGVAALVAGMALSGLFNREVERIWGFAYPLLAVLVARHALQGTPREQRWRAGLFLSLAFAHGLAIRALLSAGW